MWQNKFTKYLGLRPAQALMLLGDVLAMQAVLLLVVVIRSMFGDVALSLYISMGAIICISPILSMFFGACQMPMPPAHREIKHIFLMVTLTYFIVLFCLFMNQVSVEFSRSILIISWVGSVFAVPMLRGVMRRRLCRHSWWGSPTVFLQDKERCKDLWDEMLAYPARGLKPVSCLAIDENDELWQQKIVQAQSDYVRPIFIWCGEKGEDIEKTIFFEEVTRVCRNVLLVPCGKLGRKRFWLAPRILGTSMGFVVRQNLTDVRRLCIKRAIDVSFGCLSLIVILPLGVIIACWIRLSTKSSAIYTQERLGQGGKLIRIYKFRTMVPNAQEALDQYLANNPEMQVEWDINQKLFNDPRITPVGKFLRKTSLDELPQIINVILGNMSLVGPRPIVQGEIERYGDVYLDYSFVKPGITGLWQISGRNLTTYEQRVWYDNYYVTNWSLWMDLWILARTIPIVIRGYGAY